MNLKYYLFIVLCMLMSACKTPKDVVYLQGIDEISEENLLKLNAQSYSSTITYDDLLSISVTAWDPASVTPFNPPVFAYAAQGEEPIVASQAMYHYLVDKEGYIKFPVIGRIHVAGLTKSELSEKLQNLISKYVDNPLVDVQLLNFKITLLGDFNRPGTYSIKNDRLSILDAIGMGNDLQLTANRKNIMVIRENGTHKKIYRVDLTSPDIFSSPCFYLCQNDVIYVEPIKSKLRTRNSSTRNISIISSVMGTLSTIASMIFSIITLTNSNNNSGN